MMGIHTGDICRPGGFQITDKALAFCGFSKGVKLADIGCGFGATVRHIRQNYRLDIFGIEKDAEIVKLAGSPYVLCGDGTKLSFGKEELDGLLFECSLSKMDNPELVLDQCYYVLKPRGLLIISDLYARGESATLSGLLGRVETKESLLQRLHINGFTLKLFEDYTDALNKMWAELILKHGMKDLCVNLGAQQDDLRKIKCGYCLIIAQKGKKL